MTCSTSGNELSRIFSTSTTESTICGTGVWRSGTTGTESTICSTMRRGTRSCGLTSARRSGSVPLTAGGSSSSRKVLHTCRLGSEFFRSLAVYFFSFPPPRPCRLLALCAVVLGGLGKGHCDAHPCILELSTEASCKVCWVFL